MPSAACFETELFLRCTILDFLATTPLSPPGAFSAATGNESPLNFPLLATPTPQVKVVLYPEQSLPISRHCPQYGLFRSHLAWRLRHVKQSSAAPVAAVLLLRFLGAAVDLHSGSRPASSDLDWVVVSMVEVGTEEKSNAVIRSLKQSHDFSVEVECMIDSGPDGVVKELRSMDNFTRCFNKTTFDVRRHAYLTSRTCTHATNTNPHRLFNLANAEARFEKFDKGSHQSQLGCVRSSMSCVKLNTSF